MSRRLAPSYPVHRGTSADLLKLRIVPPRPFDRLNALRLGSPPAQRLPLGVRSFVAIAGPFNPRLSCVASDTSAGELSPVGAPASAIHDADHEHPRTRGRGRSAPTFARGAAQRGRRPAGNLPVPNPIVSVNTVPPPPNARHPARATEQNRLRQAWHHSSQPPARTSRDGLGRWFPAGSDHLESR